MNYFGSRQFYNFLKNKKTFNIINRNKVNKIKAFCLNKIETRALVTLKKSSSINTILLSNLTEPFALSHSFLSNISDLKLLDLEGKIIIK